MSIIITCFWQFLIFIINKRAIFESKNTLYRYKARGIDSNTEKCEDIKKERKRKVSKTQQ